MLRKLIKNDRGQALVEMALILPVLLLLLFGITEFGRVFGAYLLVNHSAREGARAASVGALDAEIVEIVEDRTSSMLLDITKLDIDIIPSQNSRHRGSSVEIKVQYPVKIYAPFISIFTGEYYTVEGKTIMRVE